MASGGRMKESKHKRKGFPRVDEEDKDDEEEEEDDTLHNPMLATPPLTSSNPSPKKATQKDSDDDFLEVSPFRSGKRSTNPTSTTKKLRAATNPPLPSSHSSSSSSPSPSLRRSASADSDDFLNIDPFNKTNKDEQTSTPRKHQELEEGGSDEEKVKRLKARLEKELEPTIIHLNGVWKGTIRSDLAEKYKEGGKARKGLKWNLSTGGFSEQEFDLIIDLLQHHFPQCNLHYITDVLWQEAALRLLMERKKLRSQQAEKILKAVELSSVDKKELRRYQSDSSLLEAVAKFKEQLDSPDSKSPNSSQDKKRLHVSPSSSQENPSSQERKYSYTKSTTPSSTYYSQPTSTPIDLSSFKFNKQHIKNNNGSAAKEITTNTKGEEMDKNNETLATKSDKKTTTPIHINNTKTNNNNHSNNNHSNNNNITTKDKAINMTTTKPSTLGWITKKSKTKDG